MMRRDELVEQIIMIAVLVGFLVYIFTDYDPRWFHVTLFYVSPVVLIAILIRRYRRLQEGFEYSRKVVDAQHQATGANVVGRDPRAGGGPGMAHPGAMMPDEAVKGKKMDMPDLPGTSGKRPEGDR